MTPDMSYTTGRARVVRASQYMGWEKETIEVYYCCCNNTIPKQVARIRLDLDRLLYILCNYRSMYNFSNHSPV